jgi:hypothetical protein
MEFNINGTLYLLKDTKLNFVNDKYETKEFKILKKWLLFGKEPKSLKEIQTLETKIDLFLKQRINGYCYNHKDNKDLGQDLKVPELYLRYLDLLNNIVEI